MERQPFPASSGEAIAEAERAVAWLRLPAIGLIALGASVENPDQERLWFLVTLALFSAWSVGVLTYDAFGLTASSTDFHKVLDLLVGGCETPDEVDALFEPGLSAQARAYVLSQFARKA